MQTTAKITVYVQALGGKFLGPNAYKTDNIKLTLTLEGNTIPVSYQLGKQANDGGIGADFLVNLPSTKGQSSFLPILTTVTGKGSNPAVNYLTPNNLTICGSVAVTVSQPIVLGTVRVSIPRPQGDDLVLTQSLALDQLQVDYRVILVVPGLLLEEPPPSALPDTANHIFVYVKMMCGCPITTGIPKSYWAQDDFVVVAEIIRKKGKSRKESLTFTGDATPSLFHAKVNELADVKLVNFTARQKSTGNIGYLSVHYSD
ncbi:MAG TPA: hypothetical protein VGO56_04320 [Pyrinomonadaceae bacterium]|jgi:hypothetical protein|nr:hypothetical protein [Pyrinomonadaceae bacterium]